MAAYRCSSSSSLSIRLRQNVSAERYSEAADSGTIALGAFTFTMDALPGTPQIQNIIQRHFQDHDIRRCLARVIRRSSFSLPMRTWNGGVGSAAKARAMARDIATSRSHSEKNLEIPWWRFCRSSGGRAEQGVHRSDPYIRQRFHTHFARPPYDGANYSLAAIWAVGEPCWLVSSR
jgi:hypothetical protein